MAAKSWRGFEVKSAGDGFMVAFQSARKGLDTERHFADDLGDERAHGTGRGIGWTQHEYAGMLLKRAGVGDRRKALGLLNQAIAQPLGMKALLERSLALKLKAQGIDGSDPQTSIDIVAHAVQQEQPDLRTHAAPDGTVTIMFSDIEASTELTERLGDKAWMADCGTEGAFGGTRDLGCGVGELEARASAAQLGLSD